VVDRLAEEVFGRDPKPKARRPSSFVPGNSA
jgi:hypothetical protein